MVYIYAPNGECVVWGGWNIPPTGGCTDIGTGFANSWPDNWSTTVNGFYTYNLNTDAYNLDGSGTWSVTIQNAWTTAATATYDLDIVFNGLCEGECNIPTACNYVAGTDIPAPDLCIYAIDLYPSGYYDCDGVCYDDIDVDGICDDLEIPGCQEPWACNYNPNATDPPPADNPCTYPESSQVDCDGNSFLPQFLSQPQDATVSCTSVPVAPVVTAQVAPAALTYHNLLPETCYDMGADVEITLTESVIPGNCPGNYTLQRYWEATDCNGFQSSYVQIIDVVDNLPPVVSTDLEPITLNCNDPISFPQLQYEDACGGSVNVLGEPSFISIPGSCAGQFTEKKVTVISDQCGNQTTVEQTLVFQDNQAPYWLNEPDEIIITNDIENDEFDLPVADDICSPFEVSMSTSFGPGNCPLSTIMTRTFIAVDECGNTSLPFVQTITEAADLTLTEESTEDVSCHGGSDGSALLSYEGGVGPYTEDWNGYDPTALPAGQYVVQISDANLCQIQTEIIISQPPPFTLQLLPTTPNCLDPQSGSIEAIVNGGSGNICLDWSGINPNAVPAGEYDVTAVDNQGCVANASIVVPPAVIPEQLDLTGDLFVAQGESAAYYYEYSIGSSYEWTYTGATAEEVLSIFAISLLWDSLGTQEVCVTETNQEGCSGDPVCVSVFVEDDVWNIFETPQEANLQLFPNPASGMLTMVVPSKVSQPGFVIYNALGSEIMSDRALSSTINLDVSNWSEGLYSVRFEGGRTTSFYVIH